MIILGIDPGTNLTGFGVLQKNENKLQLIEYGCIRTPKTDNLGERLKAIHRDIEGLINKHRPDIVAAESIFFFKNIKTAMDVSHARGVVVLTAAERLIPFCEFTPLEVKQAVTGYGRAEKIQIQKMVQAILGLSEIPKPDDAADALAIAICAAHALPPLPDQK